MNVFILNELKLLGVKLPRIKTNISKQATRATSSPSKLFGVYLSDLELINIKDYTVPRFILTLTSYLRKYSQKEIGLFRKAGSVSRQKELRARLENGGNIEGSEPNDVASLLKQWLRELPESLIPAYLHDLMIRCQNLKDEENRISAVLLCCHLLPLEHLHTLKYLLEFLADIASNCDVNKMGAQNLALIMAPNIFVMGAESIDKSSNSLIQTHSEVVELLIKNVERVTIVCPIFTVNSESEAQKSGDELNTSIKALDYSPSMCKKKQKNGPVQDLFTGLKKLVGQNSTSPSFSKWWSQGDEPSSSSRSASKRKADVEQLSMSPLKKQATTLNNLLVSANALKDSTPKSSSSRRKSFGLLKRKDKKKRKAITETTTPIPVEKPVATLQVIESCQSKSSPLLSEFDIDKIMSKSIFTEECALECNVSNRDDLLLSPCISKERRYNLRSDSATYKENVFLKISQKLSSNSPSKGISLEQVGSNSTNNSILKDSNLDDSSGIRPMLERNASSIRRKNFNLKASRSFLANKTEMLARKESPDIQTNGGKTNISKSQSSNELSVEIKNVSIKTCTLKRQKAFLVKPQSSNSTKRSQSVNNVGSNTTESFIKIQDPKSNLWPVENFLPTTPHKNHFKRTVRNASIIRGRPNSLKIGLPPDSSTGYGSKTKFNVKHRTLASKTSSDIHLLTDVVNEPEKSDLSLSLTLQIQNFKLSSPGEDNTPEVKNEIPNPQFKRKALDMESPKVAFNKMRCNSDSKVHEMKKRSSSKITRVHSFSEPTVRKSRMNKPEPARSPKAKKSQDKKKSISHSESDIKGNKENTVLPENTINTPENIFKTPREKYETPEVWYSGREFLDAEMFREDDYGSNKRESIIMIRKSKGHVLEKVNLFDNKTLCDTPSQPHSEVTRTVSLYNPVCKRMVKMPQNLSSSIKSNRSARNKYYPLPPTPKFVIPESPPSKVLDANVSNSETFASPFPVRLQSVIPDSSAKPSFPLKVLFDANVSNSDAFLTPSPAKSPLPALKDLSVEKSLKNFSLKLRSNSYSGHTPYKLPKRRKELLRSESFPVISHLNQLSDKSALNI